MKRKLLVALVFVSTISILFSGCQSENEIQKSNQTEAPDMSVIGSSDNTNIEAEVAILRDTSEYENKLDADDYILELSYTVDENTVNYTNILHRNENGELSVSLQYRYTADNEIYSLDYPSEVENKVDAMYIMIANCRDVDDEYSIYMMVGGIIQEYSVDGGEPLDKYSVTIPAKSVLFIPFTINISDVVKQDYYNIAVMSISTTHNDSDYLYYCSRPMSIEAEDLHDALYIEDNILYLEYAGLNKKTQSLISEVPNIPGEVDLSINYLSSYEDTMLYLVNPIYSQFSKYISYIFLGDEIIGVYYVEPSLDEDAYSIKFTVPPVSDGQYLYAVTLFFEDEKGTATPFPISTLLYSIELEER